MQCSSNDWIRGRSIATEYIIASGKCDGLRSDSPPWVPKGETQRNILFSHAKTSNPPLRRANSAFDFEGTDYISTSPRISPVLRLTGMSKRTNGTTPGSTVERSNRYRALLAILFALIWGLSPRGVCENMTLESVSECSCSCLLQGLGKKSGRRGRQSMEV